MWQHQCHLLMVLAAFSIGSASTSTDTSTTSTTGTTSTTTSTDSTSSTGTSDSSTNTSRVSWGLYRSGGVDQECGTQTLFFAYTWNSKQPVFYGCFNWMIPNHYIKNGCFTKHPLQNGCLGYQVFMYSWIDFMKWQYPKEFTKTFAEKKCVTDQGCLLRRGTYRKRVGGWFFIWLDIALDFWKPRFWFIAQAL